jgi:hypothetical protein
MRQIQSMTRREAIVDTVLPTLAPLDTTHVVTNTHIEVKGDPAATDTAWRPVSATGNAR